jgi:hypothetical protein
MTWRDVSHSLLASVGYAGFAFEIVGDQSFFWLTLSAFTAVSNTVALKAGAS